MNMVSEDILSVKDLTTYFYRNDGVVRAVDGISYELKAGESIGIVGESGSGKSVSVLSILKLLKKQARIEKGEAVFNGINLLKLDQKELRKIRGKDISMIFQDPMTSLNPTYRISKQLMEPLIWHNVMDKKDAKEYAIQLLDSVGIPEATRRFNDYPFQFSGGMRQRVMIAMALACRPKLLIADEPTTALDVTVRSQILNLLQDMKEEYQMSVIMINHDFSVATNFCDRINVMYAGQIVETAPTLEFVNNPKHPYSQGLLKSTLDIDYSEESLSPIPGNPPSLINPEEGCRFYARCTFRKPVCNKENPDLCYINPDHSVACHLVKGG
jgi:oligopeptide/dipeptide ABC transporter ATP-binding protein